MQHFPAWDHDDDDGVLRWIIPVTLFLILFLISIFFSGCVALTYKECTFNVPVHASILDLPWLKPVSPTQTPLQSFK